MLTLGYGSSRLDYLASSVVQKLFNRSAAKMFRNMETEGLESVGYCLEPQSILLFLFEGRAAESDLSRLGCQRGLSNHDHVGG